MYGHQSVNRLPAGMPQFLARAEGAYVWDHDGNRYLDLMCGYGPQLFGYAHPEIDSAYVEQLRAIDTATGPSGVMVDLAETFVDMVGHADWAMFCKNGSDATSMALMAARSHTGRRKVLLATGAYHGSSPWNTPVPTGTVADDRAHFVHYVYNDVASLDAAVAEAGDDLAGIFASPFKHDAAIDQELPDPAYARRARELCDEHDAILVVDDVRAGFRMTRDCSWSELGVEPDLSCWGKAIANGHPISCLLGNDRTKRAAGRIYVTGSFWFSAAPMAASLVTLRLVRETDYLETIVRLGTELREGLTAIAEEAGVRISQTGPPQLPLIMFDQADGSRDTVLGDAFATAMLAQGVYVHPWHNMFISAAMTNADIDHALDAARTALRTHT